MGQAENLLRLFFIDWYREIQNKENQQDIQALQAEQQALITSYGEVIRVWIKETLPANEEMGRRKTRNREDRAEPNKASEELLTGEVGDLFDALAAKESELRLKDEERIKNTNQKLIHRVNWLFEKINSWIVKGMATPEGRSFRDLFMFIWIEDLEKEIQIKDKELMLKIGEAIYEKMETEEQQALFNNFIVLSAF